MVLTQLGVCKMCYGRVNDICICVVGSSNFWVVNFHYLKNIFLIKKKRKFNNNNNNNNNNLCKCVGIKVIVIPNCWVVKKIH
jgi:hypothetical protein